MHRRRHAEPAFLLLTLAGLVGWGASRGPCDPLVPEYCQFPFPNSFYTRPDARTPTGVRVNISSETFPKDVFGRNVDAAEWNTMDGFSPFPSIMTFFKDVNDSNLPPHWNIQLSLAPNSPTILMNFDTGEILPHFAELDKALGLPQRALMLWPAQRLLDSGHYVVALRGLVDSSGQSIQPSTAFTALRDNVTTSDPDIEYRRPLYELIFRQLEEEGIERKTLQLAWDFTTASVSCITDRLIFMRDDALLRMGPSGPPYRIEDVTDNYSTHIFRRLKGTMLVPCYLSSFLPGSHLVLGEDGLPVYQSEALVTFTVLIPHSVANSSILPAMALQYGHGLFDDQSEVESDYLQSQADVYGYVLMACNWWGMDQDDVPSIALMVAGNLSNFRIIPDRLHQGMLNALALMRLMKGSLYKDPLLSFGGKPAVDTTDLHYYGNSLGGIMGDVYMAVSTDVIRGVLGVPGGPFSLLLPRSVDFETFAGMLRVLYPDPVDYISGIGLVGEIWSRLEPNGYMSFVTQNPLPNTPTHRVLYQYALGDAQVNILGLYAISRSAGAVMFNNNVRCQFSLPRGQVVTEQLFGFPLLPINTTVTQAVAAVGFDCGAPPEPSGNSPPSKKTDTHESPRRTPLALKQIDHFLRTGEIINVCNGTCKCTI